MQEEEAVKADLKASDELLSDATAKLHDAPFSNSSQQAKC